MYVQFLCIVWCDVVVCMCMCLNLVLDEFVSIVSEWAIVQTINVEYDTGVYSVYVYMCIVWIYECRRMNEVEVNCIKQMTKMLNNKDEI